MRSEIMSQVDIGVIWNVRHAIRTQSRCGEPVSTPPWERGAVASDADGGAEAWRAVDLALRSIAQRRAALDADEARWLREAEALKIWKPLGMVNALD